MQHFRKSLIYLKNKCGVAFLPHASVCQEKGSAHVKQLQQLLRGVCVCVCERNPSNLGSVIPKLYSAGLLLQSYHFAAI